jgi:hypothetical protein
VQKPNFSVAEAFSAGVRLIERSFGSVLAWAVAMFVLTLVPVAAVYVATGGHVILPVSGADLVKAILEGGLVLQRPQSWAELLLYPLLALVWLIVELAVIYAAIYRTALAGKPGRFANLRLGATEAWLSLVIFVQVLGFLVIAFAWYGAVVAIDLIAVDAGPPADRWIVWIGRGVVLAIAVWLLLRLCLSQAMTVAQGRFRFFESWGLTRGRAWKLFWTAGLVSALCAGLEAYNQYLLAYGMEIAVGLPVSPASLIGQVLPIPGAGVPVGLLWLAFLSFVSVLIRVLQLAPLAAAFRGLSGGT